MPDFHHNKYTMRPVMILFFLVATISCGYAQDDYYGIDFSNNKYPYGKWKPEVLKEANSCAEAGFMTEEEKKAVFLVNLARLDGKLFAQTFWQDYYDSRRMKPSESVTSLIKDLDKTRNLPVLSPEKDLYRVTEDFAVKNGRSGKTENKGYKARYAKIAKMYSGIVENYHLGNSEAIHIVMDMLLDDANASKTNRKNLLSKKYNAVGFSIREHNKQKYNTVMGLATRK